MKTTQQILFVAASLALSASASAAVVNVSKGGAIATIQAGVDQANPGDTVLIEKGVYQENVIVPVPKTGITLEADGKVVIDAHPVGPDGAGPGIEVLANEVTVIGIQIRNATDAPGKQDGNGMFVFAASFTAQKVTIVGADRAGIDLLGQEPTLEDCKFQGCDLGVKLADADGGLVQRCAFRQLGNDAVKANDVTGFEVLDCSFVSIDADACDISSGTNANVTIRNCRFTDVQSDAVDVVSSNAVIELNKFAAVRDGIQVEGSSCTIRGNRLEHVSGDAAIRLLTATGGLIEDNVIRDFGRSGIVLDADTSGADVRTNKLSDGHSIEDPVVRISGTNHVLDGNEVKFVNQDGFRVEGDGNTLTNNTVLDSARDGFEVANNGVINTVLTGNTAKNCQGEGLDHLGVDSTVDNNTFLDNRIDVALNGAPSSFNGNTFVTGGQGTAQEVD